MLQFIAQTQHKKEIVHQPVRGKPYSDPTITVNGQNLSRAVQSYDEVTARTVKTGVALADFAQISKNEINQT